jgi:CRP-like cAMP-binding protein
MRRGQVLAQSPLFGGAPPAELVELARHFDRFGARRGQPICIEGQEGDELYVIGTGTVDLVVATRHDRVQRLGSLGPGDAFGIGAVVRSARPATRPPSPGHG